MENFKLLTGKLNTIGERVNKAGLGFAYHNHDFEFFDYNGETAYDIIMRETDPVLVKLQMDLYWVMHSSKLSPAELFKKQPGRFVMWHIKDMDKQNRDLHTVVGDGQIDFKPIFKDYKLAGVKHMFVEQGNNYVPDSMSCVQRSAGYVKKELFPLL